MKFIFSFALLVASLCAAGMVWWLQHPVQLRVEPVEMSVEAGRGARAAVQSMVQGGAQVQPELLYWWIRLSGQARQLKAGSYEFTGVQTPLSLIDKIVRGEVAQRSVTLVEGITFAQWRRQLGQAPTLRHDSAAWSDGQLMDRLGRPGLVPEGHFYPDTYLYDKGASDLVVLRRALDAMSQRLGAAWGVRTSDCAVRTPEELLILASIVEKETGKADDRAQISAVFNNRLRRGMMLQTDPTVIYGLGARFDGNLRKRDLLSDTPWNTYTRSGLPPTPIAMPGQDALLAAAQPAHSDALYFVARGDGSSEFSVTLDDHNRAVRKYQLGQH